MKNTPKKEKINTVIQSFFCK